MLRIEGRLGAVTGDDGAGDHDHHLSRPRPRAFRIDLERPDVDDRQPGVVRVHAADVPEFAADFGETIGRRAFEDHLERSGLVRDLQLAVVAQRHRAHQDDRAHLIEGGVIEDRSEIRRPAGGRLRRHACRGQQDQERGGCARPPMLWFPSDHSG